jgi:hypothetical protein
MQRGGGKGKTHQPKGASKESGLGHLPFQNADTVPTNASDDDDARPRRGSATPVALLGCVNNQILGTTSDSGATAPEQLAVHGRLVRRDNQARVFDGWRNVSGATFAWTWSLSVFSCCLRAQK